MTSTVSTMSVASMAPKVKVTRIHVHGYLAIDRQGRMAVNNRLPWNCPEDLQFLMTATDNTVCILGRKTYTSMPKQFWRSRIAVVLSNNREFRESIVKDINPVEPRRIFTAGNINVALRVAQIVIDEHKLSGTELSSISVLGGAGVYEEFYRANAFTTLTVHLIEDSELKNYSQENVTQAPEFVKRLIESVTSNSVTRVVGMTKGGVEIHRDIYRKFVIRDFYPEYPSTEEQFRNNLQAALTENSNSGDRTGAGCNFVFGASVVHNMAHGLPTEIARKTSLRMILIELRTNFLGITTAAVMRAHKLRVWDFNTTAETQHKQYMSSLLEYSSWRNSMKPTDKAVDSSLAQKPSEYTDDPIPPQLCELKKDDIGASYGWNARCFGKLYTGAENNPANEDPDYFQKVVRPPEDFRRDQLLNLLQGLCHDVTTGSLNRRLRISLWDPTQSCALPPCMEQYQFCIEERENPNNTNNPTAMFLNCVIGQRSSDTLLAGHWNMTYGQMFCHMLVTMIYQITGKRVYLGHLTMNYGNLHVYHNQLDAAKEYLEKFRSFRNTRGLRLIHHASSNHATEKTHPNKYLRAISNVMFHGEFYAIGDPTKKLDNPLPLN